MSECYGEYFIENGKILDCNKFSDEYVMQGTSLYEVIRIIDSVPVFLERHLDRLDNSAKLANKKLWMSKKNIKDAILELIKANKTNEGNIKIIFNYGNVERENNNTFLVYFIEHHYPSAEQYSLGVPAILCFKERSNPNAKIINNNFRSETDEKIKSSNSYEAILVDRNNYITEGSRSNIFMVKDNCVITAPLEAVLPGITREIIIEICKKEEINFFEKNVSFNQISDLDALFITGTSPKILPISKVDDFVFKSSTNIIVQSIMRHYNRIIEEYIKENKK
ncbi:aminotransferase class IV family protein [Clostridium sp. YIM B02515]|uniref:Aminotransferase class IV family protein n=1 Tax=Clostridium rhizosphaerae TaxID=2803861 RepID=A0ABS1TF74_9CLOT|nr:aminotransferase class IV [Clostridium rhizosphaerae]MBL4938026.1 aminotransferase class IV family protein [Clostridium rhizosphaerae]